MSARDKLDYVDLRSYNCCGTADVYGFSLLMHAFSRCAHAARHREPYFHFLTHHLKDSFSYFNK